MNCSAASFRLLATATTEPEEDWAMARQFFLAIPAAERMPQRHGIGVEVMKVPRFDVIRV
jgi:hypothetical protein